MNLSPQDVHKLASGAVFPYIQDPMRTPPYVPSGGDYQMLAYISSAACMEIQQQANRNPVRTFMFNVSAMNQWNNEFFDSVIHNVLGIAELSVYLRQTSSMQDAVRNAVPLVVELLTAVNLRDFPALQQVVTDPNLINDIRRSWTQYDQLGQQVQNMRAELSRNQQGGGAWNTTGSGWGNTGAAWNGGANHVTTSSGWGTPAATGAGWDNAPSGWGSTPAANVAEASKSNYRERFSAGGAPANITQVQQQAAPNQKDTFVNNDTDNGAAMVASELVLPAISSNFKASQEYPYYIGYNPSTHVARLMVENGATIPYFDDIDPDQMDYDKHKLPAAAGFGSIPENLDLSKSALVLQNVRAGVQKANMDANIHMAETQQGKEELSLSTVISAKWITETTETSAWTTASIRRLLANSQNDGVAPDVYRVYAIIAKPSLGDTDESESIAALGKSMTYLSLAENLKASYDSLSPALYNVINRKMVVVVNRSLQQELGISGSVLKISDFRDDIGALIDILSNDPYGPKTKAAFLSRQRDHIRNALMTLDGPIAESLSESFLQDLGGEPLNESHFPDNSMPKITYLTSKYSLTMLNCLGWDLGVVLAEDGMPTHITKELTPLLYDLVSGIFADAENYTEVDGSKAVSTIARHLIRTRDGRILEANRGAMLPDSFLVSILE